MLAHGSAALSSTLSLWLSVTMMTGWPSSLGLRSMDRTSPLFARTTVAVVQMAYRGLREGLSTVTGVVGCALFMLLGPGLLLLPDLPCVGVPALRSGELLPEAVAAPGLLARAWQGRIAARPHVMLQGQRKHTSMQPQCEQAQCKQPVRPTLWLPVERLVAGDKIISTRGCTRRNMNHSGYYYTKHQTARSYLGHASEPAAANHHNCCLAASHM